jgi:hypothetical protein
MTSKRVPLLVGVAVAGTALLTVTALGAVRQSRTDIGRDAMAAGLTSSVTQNGVQVTAAAGAARVVAGGEVPITVTIRSETSQNAVVDLEAFDPAGRRVFQKFWTGGRLNGGHPVTWTTTWVPAATPGRHRIAVGVFTDSWDSLVAWNNTAAFVVVAPSSHGPEWEVGPADGDVVTVGEPGERGSAVRPSGGAAARGTDEAGPGSAFGPGSTPGAGGPAATTTRLSGSAAASTSKRTGPRSRSADAAVASSQAPAPGSVPAHFRTLAPTVTLPSSQQCARWVRAAATPAEVRPVNATANATAGSPLVGALGLATRVDGAFTGTTEQILRWTACKWGVDEDVVKAQAAAESGWRQGATGDVGTGDASRCVPGHGLGTDGTPDACPESFGILQVRFPSHQMAFPKAVTSTALNADYAYSQWRECYTGTMSWLNTLDHGSAYAAGDVWGCVGVWAAGRWHTAPAETYLATVKRHLDQRLWTTAAFLRA